MCVMYVSTIAEEKVYWEKQLNDRSSRLRRANLDGTNVQEIRSLTGVPRGIAVDSEDSKIYWTNSRGQIQRANTNGTGLQNVITQLNTPTHIALDVTDQRFYWSESGRIRRANFDGRNRQVVAAASNPIGGIAMANGKISGRADNETRGQYMWAISTAWCGSVTPVHI